MTLSKHSTLSRPAATNSALVADQKANAGLVYDYDGRYISGATTSRTTDLSVPDHEGIYRTFGSGEVAIAGSRVVRNLAKYSVDMSAFFTTVYSVTENSTTEADPLGTSTATEIEDTDIASGKYCQKNMQVSDGLKFGSGKTYTFSLVWKKTTGATHYAAQRVEFYGGTRVAEWVTINTNTGAIADEGLSDGSYSIEDLGDFFRISLTVTDNNTGHSLVICKAFPAYNNDGSGSWNGATPGANTIWGVQFNEGVFLDYIPTAGTSVLKHYATDGVGSALSPAPAVVTQPAFTNSCAYSQDFNTGWSAAGTISSARNQTDIYGNANSASTLTSTTNGANFFYGVTVADDSNTHTSRCWLAKGSVTVSVKIQLAGGTGKFSTYNVNTATGASALVAGTAAASVSVDEDGDWWRVTLSIANNSTGNTTLYFAAYPSWAGTGSVVLDQIEMHIAPTNGHESVRYAGPIPTNGSAATSNAAEPVVPWPAGLVNDFVVKVKWTPDTVSGTIALLGSYTDASNSLLLSWASNTLTLTKRVSATDYSATVALTPSADTEYTLSVRLSSVNGVDVWAASTKGTGAANTTDAVMTSTLSIGDDGNSANHGVGTFRDIKIFKVDPNISDEQVLAL